MLVSSRKFVIGLVVFLAAGALVGWVYDRPLAGFLIANMSYVWAFATIAGIQLTAAVLFWLTMRKK